MPKIKLEIADSPASLAQGLMFRKHLDEDSGMLFKFEQPTPASFWGKNTYIPLDVAFLDSEGVILEILPWVPFEETRVASKSDQVAYAIETNRDWFASRGLKPGLKVQGLPK